MALSSSALVDKIMGAFSSLSDTQKADKLACHTAFADSVRDYLIENTEIKSNYAGVIPAGSADPMNGSKDWSIEAIPMLTGEIISAGASTFDSWCAILRTALASATLNMYQENDLKIPELILGAPVTFSALSLTLNYAGMSGQFSSMTPEALREADLMRISYTYIAEDIVNCMRSPLNLVLNPSPAITTTPGAGVVTFLLVL